MAKGLEAKEGVGSQDFRTLYGHNAEFRFSSSMMESWWEHSTGEAGPVIWFAC